MTGRARTIFLGSGPFAVPIVDALSRHPSVDLVGAVTAPLRRGSRGRPTDTPVGEWAAEHALPLARPGRLRDESAIADIELRFEPELVVLADYGKIVPPELFPRLGALNLHPSLLPRHRGASPISATILEGDTETGVTLLLMDAGIDSGPTIAQWRVALSGTETAPELEERLAATGARLLVEHLDDWIGGRLKPRPQPSEGVTLTRPLRREDGRLDPAQSATTLERQVRAYQPWPGSFIDTPSGRITVRSARVYDGVRSAPGVLVRLARGGLALAAPDALLELTEVQPAGGRRMSGAELLRGRPSLAGARLIGAPQADAGGSA